METLILGIDTSSGWTGLGLANEEGVIASSTLRTRESRARGFATRLGTFLAECGIGPEDLSGVGVVVGPGSFTALRVGVASAQGLAMGRAIPLVPVETHEAVAYDLPSVASPALVVVPARKGEVFAREFLHQSGIGWVGRGVIECVKVEEIRCVSDRPATIAGPALATVGDELRAVYEDRVPLAPESAFPIRGETVALIARERLKKGEADFDPGKTAIRYLQSHGALTIEERREVQLKIP